MERAVAGLELAKEFDQLPVGHQRAIGDGLVDARQLLVNDAARAQVQVPDFAVAHLPRRQADVLARGAETALRVGLVEVIVERKLGKERPIALGLGGVEALRANSPTITNNQSDRFHA